MSTMTPRQMEPVSPPARRSSAQTRDHILQVAGDLFYWEGIRATGIDRVASQADVAPTTLYRLFASKDDLVAAYVERCSMKYRALLSAASSLAAGTPRDRILAVIDAFEDEVLSGACRGCPFLMVIAEFPDPQSAAHVNAVAHKAWLRELFLVLVDELALSTGLSDSALLADRLMIVSEGIYGSVQSLGPSGPAKQGRVIAELLLDASNADPIFPDSTPTESTIQQEADI
jgi:AcrR family transcriptional regulator